LIIKSEAVETTENHDTDTKKGKPKLLLIARFQTLLSTIACHLYGYKRFRN